MTVLAEVRNLTIALPPGADRPYAVEEVSFTLKAGEVLCIVGESGSGKSMSAHAMMGLLPPGVRPVDGEIRFEGQDLLTRDEGGLRALRGRRIAMIFQEPMAALNPLMRIGDQIAEVFEAHQALTPAARRARVIDLLTEVGLPDPPRLARAYPFQLSGGQRQRVVIAMALALEPSILIADEPTTALDVTTQAQILELIDRLRRRHGMAVMFITHDFGVVADIADRVIVMRLGRVVESGPAPEVLERPSHDYTRALIAAIPRLDTTHKARPAGPAILTVEALTKCYRTGGGLLRKPSSFTAVDAVSFSLSRGETLGVVGESGSGKSSLGRCLVGLMQPDRGRVTLGGTDLAGLRGQDLRRQRRRMQMIFQDPSASFNPRAPIGRIIAEGPIAHGVPRAEAERRAGELLDLVGLGATAAGRYPHEFSGGQRQRVGIARALALDPEVIIADEAVSALDVSIQAQILDLLESLKRQLQLTLIFITHDLRVAARLSDRIAVMRQGRLVELDTPAMIFSQPRDPYTRQLISAIPGQGHEMASVSPLQESPPS